MSQMAPVPSANKYDEIPYTSRAFMTTHPEHLAVMATVFGMNPTPLSRARVLEIGCAAGGNILPVACTNPEGTFLGIDYSRVQADQGAASVRDLGLANAQILHQDILDFDCSAHGKFDYIICHGVFSWVPGPVRDKILGICRETLSTQGIAYISYNTYPGWKMREIIRDMMNYHAGSRPTAKEQVQQARAILDFIEKNAEPNTAFSKLLASEVELLKAAPDDYLLHEHMEETNVPFYFKDFMAEAHKNGLNYLGESHIDEMMPHFMGPDVLRALETISGGNILLMEQYIDFFRNRRFRRTILTLAQNTPGLTRHIDAKSLKRFHIANFFRMEPAIPLNQPGEQTFTDPEGRTLKSNVAVVRAALLTLSQEWPENLLFDEWLEKTRAQLGGPQPNDTNLLEELLVKGFCGGLVRLRSNKIRKATLPDDKPLAFGPARLQANAQMNEATTIWHNTVRINDLQRVLVGLFDGATTLDQVVDAIIKKCQAGEWTLGNNGQPVTDATQIRALLAQSLPLALVELQKSGILIAKD